MIVPDSRRPLSLARFYRNGQRILTVLYAEPDSPVKMIEKPGYQAFPASWYHDIKLRIQWIRSGRTIEA